MKELVTLIEIFFNSFDTKNWDEMKNYLAEELELDYQSFRGTPKYISTSDDYIAKRKIGLQGLKTVHHSSKHIITKSNGTYKCKCNFEIKRYKVSSGEYFHSYGKYEIEVKRIKEKLKICKIKQNVERNEGNKNIHGAFKS